MDVQSRLNNQDISDQGPPEASIATQSPPLSLPLPITFNQGPSRPRTLPRKPRRERKAACTACKQQKLKCDSYQNLEKPCSRCSKFGLACFHSTGFQRSEVRKAQTPGTDFYQESNAHIDTAHSLRHQKDSVASGSDDRFKTDCLFPKGGLEYTNNTEISSPLKTTTPRSDVSRSKLLDLNQLGYKPTQSKYLADIQVDGKIIDECFEIFFCNYSPLLPLFVSQLIPNDCYKKSPTLFWAIVVVGSRSLLSDPTLLRGLAPEVLNLALTSFQMRRNQIDDIRGLLILCTWQLPSASLLRDNSVALGGLLLSLSMQAGLHEPTRSFAKLAGPGSELLSTRQAESSSLWVQVVIAYQSIMSFSGFPSTLSFTSMTCYSFERTSWQFVPNHLKLRYKTQAILSKSEFVVIELSLDDGSTQEQIVLSDRLKTLEAELNDLVIEFSSTEGLALDSLYVQIARLQLEVLQLYCKPCKNNEAELIHLFCTALELVKSVDSLNGAANITSYSPTNISTVVSLAAFTLLRMMKSPCIQLLEPAMLENGKASLFMAIQILKQMSLVNNDVSAKSAEYLTIMWTNQTIFKQQDSFSGWKLRVRNRLSMGVVFDSILVWIEQYGCSNVVATPLLERSKETNCSRELPRSPQSAVGNPQSDTFSIFTDDRWLHELDWNAGLDVSMTGHAGDNILNMIGLF